MPLKYLHIPCLATTYLFRVCKFTWIQVCIRPGTISASACWAQIYSLPTNAEQADPREGTAVSDLYNQPAKPTQPSANHKHHQVLILCFSRHTWRRKIITHVGVTGTFWANHTYTAKPVRNKIKRIWQTDIIKAASTFLKADRAESMNASHKPQVLTE